MRIDHQSVAKIDNAIGWEFCFRVERPMKLVMNRKGVVLVGKAEPGYILVDCLERGKLRCCTQHLHLAPEQRLFDSARKAGADGKEFVIAVELEARCYFRRE